MTTHEGFPRDFRNVDSRAWHGNIPMGHKYTMGVAGEEFFRRLRDKGEISATLHQGSELPTLPPRLYDLDTFAPVDKWVKVGPEAYVDTFTVVTHGADGEAFDTPRILAVVRLEGANGGLVHWIGKCAVDEVEIGMRVKAVIEPKGKRTGSLTDIRHFVPAS